jgi:hypothetical protein
MSPPPTASVTIAPLSIPKNMRSRNSSYSNDEAIWLFVLYDIDNSFPVISAQHDKIAAIFHQELVLAAQKHRNGYWYGLE